MKTTRLTISRSSVELLEPRIAPAAANLNLSSLHGAKGFEVAGASAYDGSGTSVSAAGDFNGDGIGDFIIGADAHGNNAGAVYVVFGSPGGSHPDLNLSALDGTSGFSIAGEAAGNRFGYSVSSAGDVNGDGLDDIVIGAPQANPNGTASGAVYVIYGTAGVVAAEFDLNTLDGTNGFKIVGAAEGNQAGGSVSGAGDVNGDGFSDIIIGASGATSGGIASGAAYVIFGRAAAPSPAVQLADIDGTNGFVITGESIGDGAGTSVSAAGDVNGDSFSDMIIGAPGAAAAYVVFGKGTGFSPELALATLDGISGFKIHGETQDDLFGSAVSGAGDVNGDGFADVIIGAPAESSVEDYAGASYVVFGRAAGADPVVNVSAFDGNTGFKITGEEPYDAAGSAVSSAGDVNGDGFADLIVGAYNANARGEYSGAAYVIFGKASKYSANLSLAALNGHNGFQISGAHAGDYAGSSVSGVGDVNGDGADDLLIGAPGSSANGDYSGASYVVFGRAKAGVPQDPNTVVMQDPDGDVVTITLDGGELTHFNIELAPDGTIAVIDLTDLAASAPGLHAIGSKPLNLTINVKTPNGGTGDGLTKVGFINAAGLGLGKVSLQGSLGRLVAGASGKSAIQSLYVAGDLGAMEGAPQLSRMSGGMKKLIVAGSIQKDSIQIDGALKFASIGKDFIGDFGLATPALSEISESGIAAYAAAGNPFPVGVMMAKSIGVMKIGGSMKGGAIACTEGLGSMSIFGSLSGGGLFSGGNIHSVKVREKMWAEDAAPPVIMAARQGFDTLIIKGDVKNAQILAGYTRDGEPVNPDAHIGKVVVKGDWIQSSIVAGVEDSTDDGFGQNDTVISGDDTPSVLSRIAKVIIQGSAIGSTKSGDHYGIVAQEIGALSIGGTSIDLQEDASDNVLLDTGNGDFRVCEIDTPTP